MLTPSTPQPISSRRSCDMGRIVTGTIMSQIATASLNLASVKMLGEAHYLLQMTTTNVGGGIHLVSRVIPKGYEETWQLLYATTPLTQWIWFEIAHAASTAADDTPTLQISLKSVVSGAIDGTIDAGCILDYYLETNDDLRTPPRRLSSGWALTRPPSGSSSYVPRPLYVPQAYRGQVICVRIAATSVAVTALHLIDIYQEA